MIVEKKDYDEDSLEDRKKRIQAFSRELVGSTIDQVFRELPHYGLPADWFTTNEPYSELRELGIYPCRDCERYTRLKDLDQHDLCPDCSIKEELDD